MKSEPKRLRNVEVRALLILNKFRVRRSARGYTTMSLHKYSDSISYWQSEPDGGQSAAINAGMARATGDILCWLNSDDLFSDGALLKVAKYFKALTSSCIQYPITQLIFHRT